MNVSCTGVHADGEADHYYVRGYFKGSYGQYTSESSGHDTQLLRNLLMDEMMDPENGT